MTVKQKVCVESVYDQIKFSDADIVNIDDYIPAGKYNPHNVRPFLFHDHGFCKGVVFAWSLQDAMDELANSGRLDYLQIDPTDESDRSDYMVKDKVTPGYDANCPEYVDPDGGKWWWQEGMEPMFLGNASEPFDIESIGVVELPNPPRSFCAMFNASQGGSK